MSSIEIAGSVYVEIAAAFECGGSSQKLCRGQREYNQNEALQSWLDSDEEKCS